MNDNDIKYAIWRGLGRATVCQDHNTRDKNSKSNGTLYVDTDNGIFEFRTIDPKTSEIGIAILKYHPAREKDTDVTVTEVSKGVFRQNGQSYDKPACLVAEQSATAFINGAAPYKLNVQVTKDSVEFDAHSAARFLVEESRKDLQRKLKVRSAQPKPA
jgi:hypothetical protein